MSEEKVVVRQTGMGAFTMPYSLDPSTLKVEVKWGKGTHGEARISGYGRYFLKDISNLGNHRCKVVKIDQDGSKVVLEQNTTLTKFCPVCEKMRGVQLEVHRETVV